MSEPVTLKVKKRKKTDTVQEYSRDKSKLDAGGWNKSNYTDPGVKKMNIDKESMTFRHDKKGIVKGKEDITSYKKYNPGDKLRGKKGSDMEGSSTFKKVKIGPFSYSKKTSKDKGEFGDVKSKSRTKVKFLGKSVYNKEKDIPNEDADKRYVKMEAKLKKRKKKQDQ